MDKFDNIIKEKAKKYNVNPCLIKAIIWKESGFNEKAIGPFGEIGLMQINPKAHPDFNPQKGFDPDYNIEYGTKYLRELIDKYKELWKVISAYNAGSPTFKNLKSYVHPVLKKFYSYMFLNFEFLKFL
jgi:soluble lytic murein transglycosylase-like protein